MLAVRVLDAAERSVLDAVAPDVFDDPVHAEWSREFFADPRHHLAVALDDGVVVGMASGVHYVHPDKPPELWINEVGVAPTHRRIGLATKLVHALLVHGRTLGCRQAWVAADASNGPARRLYEHAGGRAEAEPAVIYQFFLE